MDATSLITPNNYSIEMVFEFFDQEDQWRRIIDTQNRQSDDGFYVDPSNRLNIFPIVGGTNVWTNNTFRHVVLTNFFTGSGQDVRAYLDGDLELTSTTTQLNIDNANNPDELIGFFIDNVVAGGQGEFSDGRIALLRIWEGVLTPVQIENQSENPFVSPSVAAPEPAALALLLPGLALAGLMRRRR